MDEKFATEVRTRALAALRELNSIAAIQNDWGSDPPAAEESTGQDDHTDRLRTFGAIYAAFPDLNDLKDMDFSQFDKILKD